MIDARPRMRILATVAVLFVGAALHAQDAEKTTHAAGDAVPERTLEEKGAGWTMRQYRLGCLSLLSYLVVSEGRAAVIDPQRDVDRYLDDAKGLGAKIDTVILTHSHADFVAGHTELAEITGAKIYVDRDSGAEYPHVGVADGDKLSFAAVGFEFWKTPGHVLASLTILMRTPGAKVELVMGTTHKEVPQFPIAIDFDPNEKWELQATKDGFESYSQPISFEDGLAAQLAVGGD